MRSPSFFLLPILLLVQLVASASVPLERSQQPRATSEPPDGSEIAPGSTFPFDYTPSDACHAGYSPISVYLCVTSPSLDNVTTTGELLPGSYIYYFGSYLIPNYASLPPMQNPPPPPPTLTMPTLDDVAANTALHFAVVETIYDCPPTGYTAYGIDSITVIYE